MTHNSRERSTDDFSTVARDPVADNAGAKAAFGYLGSKLRLSRQILSYLPPHNCWVELCCGSAALTMAKERAFIEVINDLDGAVVNVFRQLRDRGDELVRAIELTPYSREEFSASRADASEIHDLERARRFLVRAMMTVNGVLGGERGGFSLSNSYVRGGREARVNRWVNYPKRLVAVAQRLKDVRIENRDAIDLLKVFSNRPATLVYIDPPYLTDRRAGYSVDMQDEQFHIKLLEQASLARCMIAISGYDSDVYRQHLSPANGWNRIDLGAHTRTTNGHAINREEKLWLNGVATQARHSEKVPIRLSAKEEAEGKVNPIRDSPSSIDLTPGK